MTSASARRNRRRGVAAFVALLLGLVPFLPLVTSSPAAAAGGPERISTTSSDGQATGHSRAPATSADGRYVAFVSQAHLGFEVGGGSDHLFVKDRRTGALTWVDQRPGGGEAAAYVFAADLSADGRWVAFGASGSGLVDGVDGSVVYLADLSTGTIQVVSDRPDATIGPYLYDAPVVSAGGEVVAFQTGDPEIDPSTEPATGDKLQIVRWERATDTSTVVSRATDTSVAGDNDSFDPSVSEDGGTIAFTTQATNLVPGAVLQPRHLDGAGRDVVVATPALGRVEYASAPSWPDIAPSSANSWLSSPHALSGDGTKVTFTTETPVGEFDPAIADGNGQRDVVVAERGSVTSTVSRTNRSGDTNLATCTAVGGAADGAADGAAISADGTTVVFASSCNDLEPTMEGYGFDVFRSIAGAPPELVSTREDGSRMWEGFEWFEPPPSATNRDGSVVTWATRIAMTSVDTNNLIDVWASGAPVGGPPPPTSLGGLASPYDACPEGTLGFAADFVDGVATIVDPLAELPDVGFVDDPDARTFSFVVDGTPAPQAIAIGFPFDGPVYWSWDYGSGGGTGEVLPYPASAWGPAEVAVACFGSAGLTPRTTDDEAYALGGTSVNVDVLANDRGDYDPDSLRIDMVDVGSAGVETDEMGNPIVGYDAPFGFSGTATVLYSITGYGSLTRVTGRLSVTVVSPDPTPLSLSVWAPTQPTVGASGALVLNARNTSASYQYGGVVSVRARSGETFTGAAGPGWACNVTDDVVSCATLEWSAPGGSLPQISIAIAVPDVPHDYCSTLFWPMCADFTAWNGDGSEAAEAAAAPPAVPVEIPLTGGALGVQLSAGDVLYLDSPNSYVLQFRNRGNAPLVNPRLRLDPEEADSTFVSSTGTDPNWTCTPDPGEPGSAICQYAGTIPAGASAPSTAEVVFRSPTGQTGCGTYEVEDPCAVIRMFWVGVAPDAPAVELGRSIRHLEPGSPPERPDLSVRLAHPDVVRAGGSTQLHVRVANGGEGPTVGPVTVQVDLPPGFTAVSAGGAGWSCTVDGSASCTADAVVPPGGLTPGLVVVADVGGSAVSGTAQVTVATDGDTNEGNNTFIDLIPVTPLPASLEPGPGTASFVLVGPEQIARGATVELTGYVDNPGTTSTEGPTTVRVVVPAGLPAGQVLSIDGEGDDWGDGAGWRCGTQALKRRTQLTCSTPSGIEAGGRLPPIRVRVRAVEVEAGSVVDLPFEVQPGGGNVRTAKRLDVVVPTHAALQVGFEKPGELTAGTSTRVRVDVANSGSGETRGPLAVAIPAPEGVDLVAAQGENWSCTVAPDLVECRNDAPLLAGELAEPLVVALAAPADAEASRRELVVRASTADQYGDVVTEGSVPVAVTAPRDTPLEIRSNPETVVVDDALVAAYDSTVVNTGFGTTQGQLHLVAALPAGATAEGGGELWTCATADHELACTYDRRLRPGEASTPLSLRVTMPASARGTTQSIAATVRADRNGAGAGVTAVTVPAAPPPVPDLRLDLGLPAGALLRGHEVVVKPSVANVGTGALAEPRIVALRLPPGVTGTVIAQSDLPCVVDERGAELVACYLPGLEAGATTPPITIVTTLPEHSEDVATFDMGFVPLKGIDGADRLPDAIEQLRRGQRLVGEITDERNVRGVLADAGPAQDVIDQTPDGDGVLQRTEVTLDGSGTSGYEQKPEWAWVQVAGPPVTWLGEVQERPSAGDGKPVLTALDDKPRFLAPVVRGGPATELAFQLTATEGVLSSIDTTTVRVSPASNREPSVTQVTSDLPTNATVPPAGTLVQLTGTADDPDGDALSFHWAVTDSDGPDAFPSVTQSGQGPASFTWPTDTTYLALELVVEDGYGGRATAPLRLGAPAPPLAVQVAGPTAAGAYEEVTVTGTATGGGGGALLWRWEQISGPAVDAYALASATGPQLSFRAPSVAAAGQHVVLRAVATRGTGLGAASGSATIDIALVPAPPPTVRIAAAVLPQPPPRLNPDEVLRDRLGSTDLGVGALRQYTTTTSGPTPLSYQWAVTGTAARLYWSRTPAAVLYGESDGYVVLTVTVTDLAGQRATDSVQVRVGNPPAVDPGALPSCSDDGTLLGSAYAAVGTNAPLSGLLGGTLLYSFQNLTIDSPCDGTAATVGFSNSSISLAGGSITVAGVSGTVGPDGVSLTSGTVSFPATWGLPTASIVTPLVFDAVTGSVSGAVSVTMTGLPFLALPAGFSPTTTITFATNGTLAIDASLALDRGTLTVAGTVDLTDGSIAGQATLSGLEVFGHAFPTATGTIAGTGSVFTASVTVAAPGPYALGPVELSNLGLTWDAQGFTAGGEALVGGVVAFDLDGEISSADDWSLTLTAQPNQTNVSVPGANLTLDAAAFFGTLVSDGGAISLQAALTLQGAWSPVPGLTVTQVGVQLATTTAGDEDTGPSTSCPEVADGDLWIAVSGVAEVDTGEPPLTVNVGGCVVPASGHWAVDATAALGSWQPLASIGVSVEQVGVHAEDIGDGPEVVASGSVSYSGVTFNASVTISSGPTIVVDAWGDLGDAGLGLSDGTTGHLVLSSDDLDYTFDDTALASITEIPQGISVYAAFDLPQSLRTLLSDPEDGLGLPDVQTLVISAELGGANVKLSAAITLGGDGVEVFAVDGDPVSGCTESTDTTVSLRSVSLTISLSGQFALAGNARIHLPSGCDGRVHESNLDVSAGVVLNLTGPSVSFFLSLTGTWQNALGVTGLTFEQLDLQAGINFATTPFPTPTFGLNALVTHLPDAMADLIGYDNERGEAIHFLVNVETTSPMLIIEVGESDDGYALYPFASVSDAMADAVQVDAASLVVAPLGGSIGTRSYPPGLGIGFDAAILGVTVEVGATVTTTPTPNLHAEVDVGSLTWQGFSMQSLEGVLDVDAADQTFALGLATDMAVVSGPTMHLDLDVAATTSGITGSLDGSLDNWSPVSWIDVHHFGVQASGSLSTLGDAPQLSLAVDADAAVAGQDLDLSGSVAFSGTSITTADLAISADLAFGPDAYPVTVTGTGCDDQDGTADDGACLEVHYQAGQAFSGSLAGEIAVNGLTASIDGSLNAAGVAVTGALDAAALGSFAVSGSLWWGEAADLVGISATDLTGASHAVTAGDWKVSSSVSPKALGGFQASVTGMAGSIGGTTFVGIAGSLSVAGSNIAGRAQLAYDTSLHYDFSGNLAINLGGHTLASGTLHATDTTGVRGSGNVSVPGVGTVSIDGAFQKSGTQTTYSLTGHVEAQLGGVTTRVDLGLTNGTLSLDANLTGRFGVALHGTVTPGTGAFTVTAAATVPVGVTTVTGSLTVSNAGGSILVSLSVAAAGTTLQGTISGTSWSLSTSVGPTTLSGSVSLLAVHVGATFTFVVNVTVSSSGGVTLAGSGSASGWYELPVAHALYNRFGIPYWWYTTWDRSQVGTLGISVDTANNDACATIPIPAIDDEEVCVSW